MSLCIYLLNVLIGSSQFYYSPVLLDECSVPCKGNKKLPEVKMITIFSKQLYCANKYPIPVLCNYKLFITTQVCNAYCNVDIFPNNILMIYDFNVFIWT